MDFLKEGKFYSAFLKYLNTMIKNLLAFLFMVCVVTFTTAQTTILDFETPGTSTTFQYFGSTIDGSLNQVIANPNPTGENLTIGFETAPKGLVEISIYDLRGQLRLQTRISALQGGPINLQLPETMENGWE